MTSLTERVKSFTTMMGVRYPVMNAPMADVAGAALAAAVSEAGGLGVLAADFMDADEIRAAVADIRSRTDKPFAVHVRSERLKPLDMAEMDRIDEALVDLKAELGSKKRAALPDFSAQLDAVIELKVPVVYVSFGGLREEHAEKLQAAGIRMVAAATALREVKVMRSAEADAIVVQGAEAGGPRLNFEVTDEEAQVGLLSLIGPAARVADVPVIASGGIMTGAQAAAALVAGAAAVELGTAFLRTNESAAHSAHKEALAFLTDASTVLSRTASGRLSRGVRSALAEALEGAEIDPAPYPEMWSVMRPVELAARRDGRDDLMDMPCGQGAPLARGGAATEVVKRLIAECRAAGVDLEVDISRRGL